MYHRGKEFYRSFSFGGGYHIVILMPVNNFFLEDQNHKLLTVALLVLSKRLIYTFDITPKFKENYRATRAFVIWFTRTALAGNGRDDNVNRLFGRFTTAATRFFLSDSSATCRCSAIDKGHP